MSGTAQHGVAEHALYVAHGCSTVAASTWLCGSGRLWPLAGSAPCMYVGEWDLPKLRAHDPMAARAWVAVSWLSWLVPCVAAHLPAPACLRQALADMQLMPGCLELCKFLDQKGIPRWAR